VGGLVSLLGSQLLEMFLEGYDLKTLPGGKALDKKGEQDTRGRDTGREILEEKLAKERAYTGMVPCRESLR